MARIIVTAPQLMSVVNEELPGHEIVGGDHFMDRQELADHIATADALLTSLSDPLDAEMIGKAAKLKVIGQCAAGFNNIDLGAAKQAGVVVTATPGVLHETTADLAFTLLLEVTRRTGEAERWVRAGKAWRYDHTFMLGAGLQGATLGIIGLGQIGEAMARRGAAFGMNVIYNARHQKNVAAIDAVNPNTQPTRRVDLDELLAASDVVSLHCPLTEETRHIIDENALNAMKKTAYLVNTARGACVDEAALVKALKTGLIAGAGLDVFEDEPTITEDLLTMENVVLLPHIGSAALPTREAMSRLAARNIAKVLSGEPAETPVE
ncbi:D-glycerate dehydrogenase [Cutibacterium sp.]|uniref:2-hydroxyacid dehydrogenase n=1 Tax=Cutibacterium sp. TaxID=1912221 RepID=UPI0026DA81DB|nr:D-glycerate dehydrogenase [Cutibacterium sp.]MDO4412482.1 D-glycerate dehydrogenase [Cutibacterium sp.]